MKYFFALPMILLSACSLAPDAVIPTNLVPEAWRNTSTIDTMTSTPAQWSDFGSEELNQLIDRALANNTDMAAALARIEQSRAGADIAGASLYPQVDASGSAGRTLTKINGDTMRRDSSDAGVSIAYELDLWRRHGNAQDAARQQLKATEFDRHALTLVVASETARLYTGLLAYDARVQVAQKNLTNASDVLRVTELRHREGAISGLDLAQQRTAVQNTQASIEALKNQRALFFNQLALMVGVAPSQLEISKTASLDQVKDGGVALSTPWQLLERRPDIAAAEARLRAANMDIGIARANALPSLSLALNGGVAGNPASTVIGLAASFFAPIFHGGALQGAIAQSEAARNEQVAAYQGVLLTAFREVEDALANYEAATKRRTAYASAATQARKANDIATLQFRGGSIDFTSFLSTQNALLQAEDNSLSAVQAQLAARIDLVRALGGV